MGVWNICWCPNLDSTQGVSMDEPIFKPFGKPIVHVVDFVFPAILVGAFSDSHNPTSIFV